MLTAAVTNYDYLTPVIARHAIIQY